VSAAHNDLIMMPEVDARRRLNGRAVSFGVLAPVGSYVGCGRLRVLRVRERDGRVELICGYESYERYDEQR
jgi:hypothetical protein